MSTRKSRKVKATCWDDRPDIWELPRTAEAYDGMVEQMAKAMATYTWSAATPSVREYWRNDARRALKTIGITRPKEDKQ